MTDPIITFSGVTKSYDGVTDVVKELDFEVARGEFLTLLGPSGSGKTTILMMLAGFEEPSRGEITFGGRRLMHRHGWDRSEAPDLNDRGKQLVGKVAVLTQPIAGGNGRARIGDTTWRVAGPDLPEGARVRVTGAKAETLEVEAADG